MSRYIHFSCSSRREMILQRGLLAGQTACLDNNPNKDLFFVRWHPGREPNGDGDTEQIDNDTTLFVLCMVAHKCMSEGGTLDTWIYYDNDGVIVPHTLAGEYIVDVSHPVHIRWSRQLASARVPPSKLILLSNPQDYSQMRLNTLRRYIYDSHWCNVAMTGRARVN